MIAAFFLAVTLVLPGRRLVLDVDSHLSGFTRLQPGIRPEADGRFHCKIQMVLTKDNGAWWIAAFHNVGVTPLPSK
jgi:hypothetical protein